MLKFVNSLRLLRLSKHSNSCTAHIISADEGYDNPNQPMKDMIIRNGRSSTRGAFQACSSSTHFPMKTNKLLELSTAVNLALPSRCNSFTNKLPFQGKPRQYSVVSPNEMRYNLTMKLNGPEFESVFTEELKALASVFKEYGYEIRIAGGAVRDILMGKKPKDLDFATTATPDQMKEMFTVEKIRMINERGEKHGTITARINDKENFEITTLRIDVLTDGRHAEVKFTTDWVLDANRRDLTINSMFLGLDGTLYDFFNGYDDLKRRKVAFVGEARIRVQEDYLRILRYFRFYGRIAESPDEHIPDTLEAIKENVAGLGQISGERIWGELSKILRGHFGGNLMQTMLKVGVAPYIGLPKSPDTEEFDAIWERCKNHNIQPMTLIIALLRTKEEMVELDVRLKLSCFERELGYFLIRHRDQAQAPTPLKFYQVLVVNTKLKTSDVREYCVELMKYKSDTALLHDFAQWPTPRFPVSGNALKEHGVPGGKQMGEVLLRLKRHWIENDFRPTSEQLMEHLPDILSDMGIATKAKAE